MGTKKELTREKILDISYNIFAKNGFKTVTMKDICIAVNISRGGLYSHFSSTKEIFEAILIKLNKKNEMNFHKDIENGICATKILDRAFELMEHEMNHPEESLSIAMYEYASEVDADRMDYFNKIGEEKWTALVNYGISKGEFNNVNVAEIVNILLYVYQGVRMWSCIVSISTETINSILTHIRKELIKEGENNEV